MKREKIIETLRPLIKELLVNDFNDATITESYLIEIADKLLAEQPTDEEMEKHFNNVKYLFDNKIDAKVALITGAKFVLNFERKE